MDSRFWLLFTCLLSLIDWIESHGRLIEPPSRASAWRYGFDTPHNYNDHELYCGGFTRQWVKNEGKCGVCGDAWDSKFVEINLHFYKLLKMQLQETKSARVWRGVWSRGDSAQVRCGCHYKH